MMLTGLKNCTNKVIGTKQTLKALKGEQVSCLFIARDADIKFTRPLIELAQKNNIEVQYVRTMVELGQAAGIEVGAAAVAVLKQI